MPIPTAMLTLMNIISMRTTILNMKSRTIEPLFRATIRKGQLCSRKSSNNNICLNIKTTTPNLSMIWLRDITAEGKSISGDVLMK
jgi:hypothetical protein